MGFHYSLTFITEYKSDPYSKGDPCRSICCRGDLRTRKPSPSGCYDTKVPLPGLPSLAITQLCPYLSLLHFTQVTDFFMAEKFRAEAINGPTTQNGLPPFVWDKFGSISHKGLPQYYNFTFVPMKPVLFQPWAVFDPFAQCKLVLSWFFFSLVDFETMLQISFFFHISGYVTMFSPSTVEHSGLLSDACLCASSFYFVTSLWLWWDRKCNNTPPVCGFLIVY